MIRKNHYFLMLSCPGDVDREKQLLRECVDKINAERDDNNWVELCYWVDNTFSDASMQAQDSIDRQMVENSDGLIAIFNARLGTPVHEYRCGTEEEIELMLKAHKHVSLLFNSKPRVNTNSDEDVEQFKNLLAFKKEKRGNSYCKEFTDDDSFRATAMTEIRLWLRDITSKREAAQDGETAVPEAPAAEKKRASSKTPAKETGRAEPGAPEKGRDAAPPSPAKGKEAAVLAESEAPEREAPAAGGEPGFIDSYTFVNEAGQSLAVLLQDHKAALFNFTAKSEKFSNRLNYLKKQKSAPRDILRECRQYANVLDALSAQTERFVEDFTAQWNAYSVHQKNLLRLYTGTSDEREILRAAFAELKSKIADFLNTVMRLGDAIGQLSGAQADISRAASQYKPINDALRAAIETALSDCDELENLA